MSIIKYSVNNPLIVNLLMAAIMIVGTISLIEMPRELQPKVSFNWAFIIVPFPGVGAEEVEKLVTIPIEDEVADIDDIRTISTESNEGGMFMMAQFRDISDATFKERMREIESKVNRIELPEGTLDPIFNEFDSDDFVPVISLSIVGDISERELHNLAKAMEEDLLDVKGVGQVALSGTREREIWIEVNQQKLFQHRLSLTQIAQAVGGRNINLPAGDMEIGKERYLVRSIGEVDSPEQFSEIVVRWSPDGNHLYLGEIATVSDRWKDEASRSRFDGKPAATLSISKRGNANSIEVIKLVKEVAENYRSHLPLGTKIVFTNDNSMWILDILGKLVSNARLGLILVVIILFMFLGFRNAMVAAIGIPVSFLATFAMMAWSDQTFNGSSLFGLILVLGVVVDDAIIVVENCFRKYQEGMARKDAAIAGASEVMAPVISATLTTVAAFMPLILMSGIMGKFMRVVPIVVCLTLVASLVEVFFIAPSHFAEWGGRSTFGGKKWFSRIRKIYTRMLIWTLRKRYAVVPVVLVLAILMGALIPLVGVELYRGDEWSQFWVWVTMPVGTRLEETDQIIKRVEKIASELPHEELHTVIGNSGILQMEIDWILGDHVGQVIVDLVEKEFRSRSMDEIMAEVREKVGDIEGILTVQVQKMSGGPPVGKPVEVKVKGKYLDELAEVRDLVKQELASMPGVFDVADDFYTGKQEIQIVIDEARASQHGLSVAMIASEVRTAVHGYEATVFRDGDEEIDVRVRLAGIDKGGMDALRSFSIVTPTGALVRLDNICSFKVKPTLFRIRRFERERAITVTANIDKEVTTPIAVNQELAKRYASIEARYPGYKLDFRGEMQEFEEAFSELGKLFLFGVLLIFTILGAQFKSLRQALIILLTIPFAFIGSMLGLLVTQSPFSLMTMYGMVALAGIAVNDAIVMVTFINNARKMGEGKWRSIIEAGRLRLRPIILTSVTTILGLMPMAIGLGGKSETWGPLANTIVWGLAVATLLTLLVVPTVYSIVVDEWFGWMIIKRWRAKRIA